VRAVLAAKWRMLLGRWGWGRGASGSAGSGGSSGSVWATLTFVWLALAFVVFLLARGFFRMVGAAAPGLSRVAGPSGAAGFSGAPAALGSSGLSGAVLAAVLGLMALVFLASAAATAFGTLYASSDLELLLSWPLTAREVLGIKLVEILAAEAAGALVLGLPVLAAFGAAARAPAWYYVLLPFVTLVLLLLPTGLALLLNLAAMRLIPAHRAREVGLALGAVLGAVVYGACQLLPAAVQTTSALGAGLASLPLTSPYLPTTWLAAGLAGAARGSVGSAAAGIGGSALAGGLVLAAALGVVPAVFASGRVERWRRGRSRGRPQPRSAARPASEAGVRGAVGEPASEAATRGRGPAGTAAVGLVRKELACVLRDAAEWSQALYGLVIVAVMVVSKRMVGAEDASTFALGAVPTFLLGLGTTVLGVGSALGLGAVAREGKARWFVLSAPLTPEQWLGAKMAAGALLVGPVAVAVTLVAGLSLARLTWAETAALVGAVAAAAPGATAISILVGAGNPVFDAPDPRRRVAPSAGFQHFFLQVLYVGGTSALFGLVLAAGRALDRAVCAGAGAPGLGLVGAAGAGSFVVPLATAVAATVAVGAASWLVARRACLAAAAAVERWE